MLEYFIGVDGGGTKTDAIATDLDGKTLATANTGPTSLTATNLGMASFNLLEAIRQLTAELPADAHCKAVSIGLAGLDTEAEKTNASKIFGEALTRFPHDTLIVVNDIQPVLAAGTTNPDAIALISGTGSQCFGYTADGKTARTSGMDFLLTDQGSGYEIGRSVLRAAALSFDGRIEKSVLETLVLQHFEVTTYEELKAKIYAPLLSKAEVAELSKECVKAYESGDLQAKTILMEVVDDLELMVQAVVRRLELTQKPVEMVCSGSIVKLPMIFEPLKQRLSLQYPQLSISFLARPPAYGSVLIAQRELKKQGTHVV